MSEPEESATAGDSGAAGPEAPAPPRPRTPSLTLPRLRRRAGWGLALAGVLILVALVATGPLWAPLLPWAAGNEPPADARPARADAPRPPDAGTTQAEAPRPPPEPQRQPTEAAGAQALQRLGQRVEAFEYTEQRLAADVGDLSAGLGDLARRVDAAEKAVKAQSVTDPTDIALVLALLQIRDAIEAGRPFTPAYEALVALAQGRPEIAAAAAPLAEPAAAGLPGRPVLASRLRELAATIAAADASPTAPAHGDDAAPDWAGRVLQQLSGLVTIRRIDGAGQGERAGGPPEAVKAALQALAGGDLEGAVGVLDKLTGAPAETLRPWLRMAKERLAAEAALQRIEALLVARLGSPANAPAGAGPPR